VVKTPLNVSFELYYSVTIVLRRYGLALSRMAISVRSQFHQDDLSTRNGMTRPSFKTNALWHSSLDDLEAWNSEWLNVSQDRHSHEFFQLSLTRHGVGRISRGGHSVDCPAEHCLIIHPEEVHELRPLLDTAWLFETLYLPVNRVASILPNFAEVPRRNSFTQYPIHDSELNRRFVSLHAAVVRQDEPLRQDELLVLFLERIGCHRGQGTDVLRQANHSAGLERVRGYLETRLAQVVSLQELADLAGIGSCHLLRLFRQRYGLPPHAYHLQVRIWRARSLLKQGAGLAEVAARTGFADQSHLTRHFKRLVGVTPGNFRPMSKTFKTR
jgi:AraC-like DNA-binding protein